VPAALLCWFPNDRGLMQRVCAAKDQLFYLEIEPFLERVDLKLRDELIRPAFRSRTFGFS
jgi:hypothetical protein